MVPPNDAADLLPITVVIPIVVACVLLCLNRHLPRGVADGAAIASTAVVALLDIVLLSAADKNRLVYWMGGWTPKHGISVGIAVVGDQFSAGIALLAALLMCAALIYSWRYFESSHSHYHALMLLFLAGMTGFAFAGDVFTMFVFFELMGVAAYAAAALVRAGGGHRRHPVRGDRDRGGGRRRSLLRELGAPGRAVTADLLGHGAAVQRGGRACRVRQHRRIAGELSGSGFGHPRRHPESGVAFHLWHSFR